MDDHWLQVKLKYFNFQICDDMITVTPITSDLKCLDLPGNNGDIIKLMTHFTVSVIEKQSNKNQS